MCGPIRDKLKSRADVVRLADEWRRLGKSLGFTSGSFDLLHPGHVQYLENAAKLCDVLVVGVNTDESVRSYKQPERPICAEQDRALVVAGLASVDYVFLFSERNNNVNVELLKPDVYVKAGDYDKSQLSSAPVVEAYGGRVELVPAIKGYSTSLTIETILDRFSGRSAESIPTELAQPAPAIFLDRDGTIIENAEYLHEPEKLRFLPGALQALRKLQDAGFLLVIVTNQPGIGFGYFPVEDFFRVNKVFLKQVSAAGVSIDKIYFCPHTQAAKCACRKPRTALVERAFRELNIDAKRSFTIGDALSDVQMGKDSGTRAVLLAAEKPATNAADFVALDLSAAVDWILSQSQGPVS